MSNRRLITNTIFLCGLYFSYTMNQIFGQSFYADVLSACISLFCLLFIRSSLRYLSENKRFWMTLLSFSSISFFIDLFWLLKNHLLQKFNSAPFQKILLLMNKYLPNLEFLYVLTSVFLAVSVTVYILRQLSEKNQIQTLLDILCTLAITAVFLWSAFFGESKFFSGLSDFLAHETVYLFLDFYIVIGMLSFLTLQKKERLPAGLLISVATIIICYVSDILLAYVGIFFHFSPAITDYTYYLMMILFAVCALMTAAHPKLKWRTALLLHPFSKIEISILLLLFLSMFYMYSIFSMKALIFCIVIVMIRNITSSYINMGIQHEDALQRERELKSQLDKEVQAKTAALLETNKQLFKLANSDMLTGLFNRFYLVEQMERLISQSRYFALFLIDIDSFRSINDIYGHDAGDSILMECGRRLSESFSSYSTPFRLSADEFCLLTESKSAYDELADTALLIMSTLKAPIHLLRYNLQIDTTVGIARFPIDGTSPLDVLRYADIAKQTAKEYSSDFKFCMVDSKLKKKVERERELELMLRQINFSSELKIFYQPVFSVPENKLIGMEALIRWFSKDQGFISPGEFIPVAEKSDLIVGIENYVLESTFAQIKKWNRFINLKVSINITPQQFEHSNFIQTLTRLVEKFEVKTSWIDLEITERAAIFPSQQTRKTLDDIHRLGFNISIDDFGTGYSSLNFINQFYVDRIKIAKELIDDIETDSVSRSLVKSIIMMAQGMEVKTVAEGVETQAQYEILKDLGCYSIQGYLLGKPLSTEEFEERFSIGGHQL